MTNAPVVGVLALQGDVAEHVHMLAQCGAATRLVKTPEQLAEVQALVIPGGESTTISMLAKRENLLQPLRARIKDDMPTLGTCAGLIFLADRLIDARADQESIGALDATVRRNAFGRQVDSFEQVIHIRDFDEGFHAVFIRAPWVEQAGPAVEVLATITPWGESEERIIMVKQGNVLATAFHPELTGDSRVHELLCRLI